MPLLNKPQLFMFHPAGGNCYSFQFLTSHLLSKVEVHVIELPGRGKRIKERLIGSFPEALKDLTEQLCKLRNGEQFIIYGHSMGAIMGLYVTNQLEQYGDKPGRLIMSGSAGPNVFSSKKNRYELSDELLTEELISLGGVSKEFLESQELMDFYLPILRADFEILEKKKLPDVTIQTDLDVLMGDNEKWSENIGDCKFLSTGNVTYELLSGNHFFIYDHVSELSRKINGLYDSALVL